MPVGVVVSSQSREPPPSPPDPIGSSLSGARPGRRSRSTDRTQLAGASAREPPPVACSVRRRAPPALDASWAHAHAHAHAPCARNPSSPDDARARRWRAAAPEAKAMMLLLWAGGEHPPAINRPGSGAQVWAGRGLEQGAV